MLYRTDYFQNDVIVSFSWGKNKTKQNTCLKCDILAFHPMKTNIEAFRLKHSTEM